MISLFRTAFKRLFETIERAGKVIATAAYRFYWDDCFSRAAALAYTTLFALVPLTALSISMFPVFGVQKEDVALGLKKILGQLLPPMGSKLLEDLQNEVFDHLLEFSGNVQGFNTVSIGVLVFTSIALLNTIESALNVIWRVTSDLSIVSKIVTFWAVVSLGTLLIAYSIFWTTHYVTLMFVSSQVEVLRQSDPLVYSRFQSFWYFLIPVLVSWIALALLYYKLPSAKVRLRDAAFGGLMAAFLFELAKRSFAYYVSLSSAYSTLYGVLASIPLFLFWLYLMWVVILLGAEISYQSGSIKILTGLKKYATDLGEIGAILGLRILYCIGRNFLEGQPAPTEGEIAIEAGADPVLVRSCLNVLTEANFISTPDPRFHSRSLVVAPNQIHIRDIATIFLSKKHRNVVPLQKDAKDNVGHEVAFLEILRRLADPSDQRAVGEYTLEEFIRGASSSMA